MYRSWSIRLACIAVCVTAFLVISAAQSTDDLPSAPSAVVQQKNASAAPAQPSPTAGTATTSAPNSVPKAASDVSTPGEKTEDNASTEETPDSHTEQRVPSIVVPVNEVSVVFTVTDKHNHYVKDLGKNDFKDVDDERQVEEIRSFRRETDLPIQVRLLIESSRSVRDCLKIEQKSTIEFLNYTRNHQ